MSVYVCLSVSLSVCLSICLYVCPFVDAWIRSPIRLPVYQIDRGVLLEHERCTFVPLYEKRAPRVRFSLLFFMPWAFRFQIHERNDRDRERDEK